MFKRRWYDQGDLISNGAAAFIGFAIGFGTRLSSGEPGAAFFMALACGAIGVVIGVLVVNGIWYWVS